MNVRELITALTAHDMTAQVIVALDNGDDIEYKISTCIERGRYVPHKYVDGRTADTGDFHRDGTYIHGSGIGVPAIVITFDN